MKPLDESLIHKFTVFQRCPKCGEEWLGREIEKCDCGAMGKNQKLECLKRDQQRIILGNPRRIPELL